MQRRTHLIFASLMLLGLIGWWFTERGQSPGASSPAANVAETEQPKPPSEAEIQKQFATMEQDKQSVAAELSRRADDQSKRTRAGAKTVEYRKYLQVGRSPDWSKFLRAHWPAYLALRAKAAASRNGQTSCTICDGRGSMDSCFLCGGTGICPTCKGTGKLDYGSGELCPTCLGTGQCYLCGGTGRMICPFCDDGMIDSKAPFPPNLLPLVPPPFH